MTRFVTALGDTPVATVRTTNEGKRPPMQTPTILSRDRFEIYLNDHFGAATAGLELVRRSAASNEGTEFGPPLQKLAAEIEEDRDELRATIGRLGYRTDAVKVAAGWAAEKLGRLKPNGQITGYSPLGRLLELEGLIGGISSKQALWSALGTVAGERAGLDATKLGALESRADAQLEVLAGLQRSAAALALR